MSTTANPFRDVVHWLARNAGFPAVRLPARAENMVCVAALAALEEAEDQQRFLIKGQDPAQVAALKAHAMRRSLVHYKSDNSAKV